MSCTITAGFGLQCKDGIGGIKKIYLNAHNLFAGELTIDAPTEMITASASEGKLFEFVLPKSTGSFTEEVASSVENGTIFYTQTVTASFHKLSAPRRKQLELIAQNRLFVIVLDNNDNYWVVGYEDGAEVTAASTMTGTAKGDMNGYTITFTADSKNKAYRIEDGVFASDFTIDNAPSV
jgi:hypothetical protein